MRDVRRGRFRLTGSDVRAIFDVSGVGLLPVYAPMSYQDRPCDWRLFRRLIC